jgi:hypothetical protein
MRDTERTGGGNVRLLGVTNKISSLRLSPLDLFSLVRGLE